MSTKEVNLTKLVEPKFLTLTGMPANQMAFKVIRKDGETMNMQHVQRRRAKRSDSLVSITFEEGLDEAGVRAVLEAWGIDEATVETSGNRLTAVMRADAENTMTVGIGDGRTATVLKPISNSTSDEKKHIAVSRMDFATDAFPSLGDVQEWLATHDVDTSNVKFSTTDTVTIVQRIDSGEQEFHAITVDTGVNFRVIRADASDIPEFYLTVVSDTAYGQWGWGQLDFSSYMADREFCDVAEDALYALRNVLDRILFYSEMPVSVRKDLVRSAVTQYADYVVALMDALPSKVVVAIRSSSKEKSVTTANKGAPAAQRSDTTPAADTAAPAATPAATPAVPAVPTETATPAVTEAPLQRSDVAEMIAQAVAAAMLASRSDAAAAPAAPTAAPAEAEPTLADVMRSVKALGASVTALEGGTVVRSDSGDSKPPVPEKADVFRGMFAPRKS